MSKDKEANRLQRVMYFLDAARGTDNIGVKIAFYCTCFEALFSTGIAELAHKLAERIAFFVGATPKERHAIYNDIKSAYTIRSKVIHGDRISTKTDDKPKNIAMRCDSLLRTMLNKVLESPGLHTKFNGSSSDLDRYFLELSFGKL